MKKRLIRVMGLCLGLSLACSISINAQKVTFNKERVSLKQAFERIESVSKYKIAYNAQQLDVNKQIVLNQNQKDVLQVLDELLKGTGCTYKVEGNYIVITSAKSMGGGKIKGTVVDGAGIPIIGANVLVKGTTTGVITDIDGNYELDVPAGAVLQVSYIGYNTQELAVGNKKEINFQLKENTELLDEVVVVGYGVEKKVNVVGSISTVSAKKLENRSTPSVANALTGQMPGVTVRQTSGSPGDDSGEIRIRGVGSFGATPSALVLVDGIPGKLSDLHMEDIESISVLKDASTAAIYGSRAANGVILVTTKTGKEGKTRVNYNGYVGFSSATAIPNKVDTWEYATLYNKAVGSEVYSAEEIQKFKDGSDPDNYANSRYLDELFGNGLQTGHDLSISGGNNKNQYMLSFGYLYQDGIIEHNDYSRYNGRLNMVTNLWPKVTVTSRVQGVYGLRKQPSIPYGKDTSGVNAIIRGALRWPGIIPTVLSNGNFSSGEEGFGTPISWLSSPSFNNYDFHSFSLNERVDYTPIKDLKISLIGAYDYRGTESKHFRSTYQTDVKTSTSNYIYNDMTKNIYKTFQATADYNHSFGDHNVGVLFGYSWEENDYRYISASRTNLPSDSYPEVDTGDADSSSNSAGGDGWALQSLFGRLKYNFKERYLLDATFRYDGSSRFPKDNRYAFFPSVAAGWRISEESFIKDNYEWINNLKLKASIGKLGNQEIGNYPYQSVYNLGYNYSFGSSLSQGVAITTAVDPTLHWEETKTMDAGIEGNLWNGLLNFDITYFYRKTTGILFSPSASVSSIFGYNLSQMNMGELENKGWEFTLGHQNAIGNFKYNVSANFSIIKNKVLTLGLADVVQDNGLVGNGTYFVNYPMNVYYGYETDGVFLDQTDIDSWYDQSSIAKNPKVGDIRYVDQDGDGKVTAKDRKVLGSRIPKYTYGITLGGEYKGLDFSVQLQGVAGVKGYLSGSAGYAFYGYGSIQRWQADGYFDPEHPTRYPKYPRLEEIASSSNNTLTSDFWVRNAAYMRIKNVQVGYRLPQTWLKPIGIEGLRFYAQCENPITFHHFPEGWDPEINTDGMYYPILRTFTLGVNLNF